MFRATAIVKTDYPAGRLAAGGPFFFLEHIANLLCVLVQFECLNCFCCDLGQKEEREGGEK